VPAEDPRGYQHLETRLGRIRFLLDNWENIWGPFLSGAGGGGGSGLPPMLSRMASHPSVVELARCLDALHASEPTVFRHLKAFRCGVEWRNVTRFQRVRRHRGKGYDLKEVRVREPIVPSWVDLGRVAAGEQWLASEFGGGEVFLPDELWDAYRRPAVAA